MEKHNNTEQQNELHNNEQNLQQNDSLDEQQSVKQNEQKPEQQSKVQNVVKGAVNMVSEKGKDIAKDTLKSAAKGGLGLAGKALLPIFLKAGLGLVLAGALAVIVPKVVEALKGNSKIDETMTIVEEVKKIGEFVSACYFEELVVTRTKPSKENKEEVTDSLSDREKMDKSIKNTVKFLVTPTPYLLYNKYKNSECQIVLLTRGKIRAGFDLQKLTEKDFKYVNDTLFLTLPQVETFDIIMNPSDITVMYETGKWSHEEITGFVTMARDSMVVNAKNYGYEEKARDNGVEKLKSMFATFGFPNVVIDIKQ